MDKVSDENLFNIASTLGTRSKDYRGPNVAKMVGKGLRPGSVLDIGCGSGFYMRILKNSGFDVHGIEPNFDMIRKSRIFGRMDIRRGVAEKVTDVFREKFDNIVMIDVLEHIEDDRKLLRDSFKLLKKGGRMAILVPAYPSLFCRRDKTYGHYRRYSKSDLKAKIQTAGFVLREIRYWAATTLPFYVLYSKLSLAKLSLDAEEKYLNMRGEGSALNNLLGKWFSTVENRFNFGFGVNLFAVAEKAAVK